MKEKDWEKTCVNREAARLACETAFKDKRRALSERGEVIAYAGRNAPPAESAATGAPFPLKEFGYRYVFAAQEYVALEVREQVETQVIGYSGTVKEDNSFELKPETRENVFFETVEVRRIAQTGAWLKTIRPGSARKVARLERRFERADKFYQRFKSGKFHTHRLRKFQKLNALLAEIRNYSVE